MKNTISFILSIVFIFTLTIPAFATTNESESSIPITEDLSDNYNVSTVSPWENIATRGVDPPSVAWNVNTQGPYEFRGSASYSRLYLSRLIWGDQYFQVDLFNQASTNLTVNPMDGVPVAPYTVAPLTPANSPNTKHFTLRTGADYFCLSFDAPSNFKGTVSSWVYQ